MWIPVIILGCLGIFFGTFLTYFSIKFKTEENPLLKNLYELMPNANCGACGLAGCSAFAEAMAEGKIEPSRCVLMTDESIQKICSLLGIETEKRERQVARVLCSGGNNAKRRFEYKTIQTCNAVSGLFNTNLECSYGCLGMGDCVRICPFDVIYMDDNNLPVIDSEKCTGCGKCVAICPKNIIKLISADKNIYIACSSHDRGPIVIKACKTGCIGCGRCVKVCPQQAITMEDNLPVIDYNKCDNCGRCVEECPKKVIFDASLKEKQGVLA
ncbi:MAG: RnfABCDGE type electron transport complex subunit B [Candidatus Ratteibacteria bacterium]|nr:RnfABCDGE type electron transport complex subunit B [Candidatus Ratteibacteria bacterium]